MPRNYLYTNPIPNSVMESHGVSWRHTVSKGSSSDQHSTGHDVRYKFTGKERDTETGFDYFGARYYDSELSIWLGVDPLASKFPNISPYAYVFNNPINNFDPDGRFVVSKEFIEKYPYFYKYLTTNLVEDVMNNSTLKDALKELGGFTDEELLIVLKSGTVEDGGTGPNLLASDHPGENENTFAGLLFAGGYTNRGGAHDIEINSIFLKNFEEEVNKGSSQEEMQIALAGVFYIIMHKSVHYGDLTHGGTGQGEERGIILPFPKEYEDPISDLGDYLEYKVWGQEIGGFNHSSAKSILKNALNSIRSIKDRNSKTFELNIPNY